MSNPTKGSGKCLCGATLLEVKNIARDLGACHCSICRKWSGGPLLAVDCGTEVTLHGEENISVFDSSEWADRGFCKKCGTHLFYRLKESGQYIVPVGLIDIEDDHYTFNHQVFVDEKPSYYQFANTTNNMTGAEIFASYDQSK